MHAAKRFTLIELLIVISIIAVLISLLLPALKASRDKASVILCIGNLKQTGIGLTSYAGDWDAWLPQVCTSDGLKTWVRVLCEQGYMGGGGSSALLCPMEAPYKFNPKSPDYSHTYGMWTYDTPTYQNRLSGAFHQVGNVPYTAGGPSMFTLIADSSNSLTSAIQYYHVYGWYEGVHAFAMRHNSKFNGFFADGHCEGVNSSLAKIVKVRYCISNGVSVANY